MPLCDPSCKLKLARTSAELNFTFKMYRVPSNTKYFFVFCKIYVCFNMIPEPILTNSLADKVLDSLQIINSQLIRKVSEGRYDQQRLGEDETTSVLLFNPSLS